MRYTKQCQKGKKQSKAKNGKLDSKYTVKNVNLACEKHCQLIVRDRVFN